MKKTKWFELLVSIGEMRKGHKIQLEVDANGVPLAVFWKRRCEEGGCLRSVSSPVKKADVREKMKEIETKKKEEKK